jgi:sec-independent protein translocase protein TatB
MNIFGVGGMELALILLIMLIVAGPKRMIRWAYVVGTYTAKFRKMWEETVDYIQKEVDEAGLDIQVPREVPTRATLNREISKVLAPVAAPVQEALDDVNDVKKKAVNGARVPADATKPSTEAAKPATAKPASNGKPAAASTETPPSESKSFGTWSGASESPDSEASS